ncbi:MAG: RHS repeat domain-containing protein [Acidobacteriaceae bacterium]
MHPQTGTSMLKRERQRRLHPILVALSVLFLGVVASAQTYSTISQSMSGTQAYQAYDGVRENIDLATGNLNLQIPLVSIPGRNGHNFNIGIEYDSKTFYVTGTNGGTGTYWYWDRVRRDTSPLDASKLGWRWMLPVLTRSTVSCGTACSYQTGFVLTTPDGSTHQFRNAGANYNNGRISGGGADSLYESDDNEFILLDTSSPTDAIATLRDGTSYHFPLYPGGQGALRPTTIEDSNGNVITIDNTSGTTTTITDTVGRVVTLSANGGPGLTFTDSNGNTQTISFTLSPYTESPTFVTPSPTYWGNINGDKVKEILGAVTLPDGRSFQFSYNGNAELTKISYPSGGYTSYVYGRFQNKTRATFTVTSYSCCTTGIAEIAEDFREVTERHVCRSASGSCSTEDITTYTPSVDATKSNNQSMDVVDPLGNKTTTQFTYTTAANSKFLPQILSVTQFQGTQTALRTASYTYTPHNTCTNGPGVAGSGLPTQITTTLNDTGLVSAVQYDYDTFAWRIAANGTTCTIYSANPISKREYDYGNGSPGPLLRKSISTWLNSSSYVAKNILDRKTSEVVQDGSGNTMAQSIYEYDTYTAGISASGAIQHDSGFSTGYTLRGNVTAVKQWRNTDGAWLTTRNQYDDAGNVLSVTAPSNSPYDSLTRTTTYSFADAWDNSTCAPSGGNAAAYPSRITDPVGLVVTHTYKSCSGSVATTTDPNNQVTRFSYDLMNRLQQSDFPDGGQVVVCISDISGSNCAAPNPFKIVTTQKITSGLNKVSTAVLDGLARLSQTQLNSDPEGVTYVDITYDGKERKSTESNPYRSISDPTYGLTTYQRDGLGRVTKMIPPDGSGSTNNVSTSYVGNCATVTDEAGKSRKSCQDALGRLVKVFEDPSGLNYETDYQYNALNNLLRVDQKGSAPSDSAQWRTRTFTYNSLSQLLCAANPEIAIATCPSTDNGSYITGTVRYVYDNVGNLVSKTSPAPNQASSSITVQTSYSYDAANRVVLRSHNDGTTPTVRFAYDGGSLSSCVIPVPALSDGYPKGQRTGMCDGSGATSWSHDQMGRVAVEKRTIVGTANITNSVIYTYNLDGSQASVTYPSTSKVITYTPGGAGHALSAVDASSVINYAFNATYAPFGGLAGLSMGAKPITIANQYDNRLQPTVLEARTISGTIMSLSYDFHRTTADNGNIYQIRNNRDSNRTQNFVYDPLNRISQAYTVGTNWGETFGPLATDPGMPPSTAGIDAWGNLTQRSGVNGKSLYEPLSCQATGQNRLSSCSVNYDAAGNVVQYGSATYVYDAENRLVFTNGYAYFYDGAGKRVKKCTSSQAQICQSNAAGTLYWTGTAKDALVETDMAGTVQKSYVFFNSRRIARIEPGSSERYYFSDHLGTHGLITNSNGDMPPIEESDFYPYGGEIVVSGADSNHYKFTGKERDPESGLDNFGARFDASTLGRFISIDGGRGELQDPQTLNKYAYVTNNPLRYVDPDGFARVGSISTTYYFRASEDAPGPLGLWLMLFGGKPAVEFSRDAFAPRWPNQAPGNPHIKGEPGHPIEGLVGGGAFYKIGGVKISSIDIEFDKNGKAKISQNVTNEGSAYSADSRFLPEDPTPEMGEPRIDRASMEKFSDNELLAIIDEASLRPNDPVNRALIEMARDILAQRAALKKAAEESRNNKGPCFNEGYATAPSGKKIPTIEPGFAGQYCAY